MLCTDCGSGRARALAEELGGEAVPSNRELAERADVVVLARKPAQLAAVAQEIAGAAELVVSILARTTQAELRAAYPETPVFRIEPNTPVELKRGVLAFAAPDEPCDEAARARVEELFARLGTVVTVPEPLMRVAGATRRRRVRRTGRSWSRRRSTPRCGAGSRRARRDDRDGDDGRLGGAAARARAGHAAGAPRGGVARRHDRPGPGGAGARRHPRRLRAGDGRRG